MVIVLFRNLTNKDKSSAVERLIKGSTPSQDYFFMIILSILTATFGLLLNNVAVIIGSMLIAPMLYPVLSLAMGINMSDSKLISRSLFTVLKSFTYGIAVSALATLLFSNHFDHVSSEIALINQPSLSYAAIAVIAGLAGSFALVKPQLNETLPGIAISVALIPPVAVTGIGMAKINLSLISGGLLLFLVNSVGITLAGTITFSLMNFYVKRTEAKETVKKEDQKVERVVKKVEKSKGK
jgi:uncharacterized hydrophobic protein (TIGR00271 family)